MKKRVPKRALSMAAIAFAGFVVLAFSGMPVYGEDIKVGGGGAAISTVFLPVKPHFEKATGITLSILQTTPKDGLIDLLKGKVHAATGAIPLENMVAAAEKDGVKADSASLEKIEIGANKTVVFVHKDNPVKTLSKDQMKGIFTGKIASWKEVGGNDQPIIVVWGKNTPGQNAMFVKHVLGGEEVTKDVLETTNYPKIRESVAANPEAIGIDPLGMADGSVKVIEPNPGLASPIILVTMGKPPPEVQKLVDYIRGEGKAYVK